VSSCIATLFLASLAAAQVRIIPQNFAWRKQPSATIAYPVPNDPSFVNIPYVSVHGENGTDAVDAANDLADQIEEDILYGKLAGDGSNLTIILHGWGHDFDTREPDTRLYQTTDALTLSGTWPVADPSTARAYSHPWLLNGTGTNPPLMAWTRDFVDQYVARMNAFGSTLPAPRGWYMDCEEFVALPVGRNGVYFLEQAAASTKWTQLLPGFPLPGNSDDSADKLYTTAANAFGWNTNILAQITSANGAEHVANRAVMAWWIQLTQRSLDATMKRCFYDVVHDAFPACRVGNYGNSRYDGLNDTTGWFMDRDCIDETCDTRHEGNELPRGWIERQWYGVEFWPVTGPFAEAASGRWVIFPEWSSGDVDSPYLYPINQEQYDGAYGFYPGHGLANPYRPTWNESLVESTLRLDRHAVESAINSYGGGHEDRMAPWVPFTLIEFTGAYQGENELRPRLMMLRGKNVPERLIFTEEYTDVDEIRRAWFETRSLTRRVDAPWIHSVKLVAGMLPAASESHDPEQLEFTLRVDDVDRTVDAHPDGEGVVELQVEFMGLDEQDDLFPSFQINLESSVEGAVSDPTMVAWDWENEEWVVVPLYTNQSQYNFTYPTPDQSCRESFLLQPVGDQVFTEPGDPGHMVLRILHTLGDENDVVRHDLVQVVRVPQVSGPSAASRFALADTDYDGASDSIDLGKFLSRWVSVEPGADVNFDGNVDESDYDTFLSAWVAQQ